MTDSVIIFFPIQARFRIIRLQKTKPLCNISDNAIHRESRDESKSEVRDLSMRELGTCGHMYTHMCTHLSAASAVSLTQANVSTVTSV